MNKKTQRALNVLEQYRMQLSEVSDERSGNNWKAKVLDGLKHYIGTDSHLYLRFSNEVFVDTTTTPGRSTRDYIDFNTYTSYQYNGKRKEYFDQVLKDVITHITNQGLKEDYVKTNFLSPFSTKEILAYGLPALFTLAGLVFWLGWFVGDTQRQSETFRVEAQLKDSTAKCVQYREFIATHSELDNDLRQGLEKQIQVNKALQHLVDSIAP